MDPGAFPLDAEAALASAGFRPGRRLSAEGGLARWRAVSHDDLSACTAFVLPTEVGCEAVDRRIELLTTLRHPHLVATYRSLATERGSRVVLGGEVDGLPLDLLRGIRPLWEPGEVVTLVAPLAGALAYLHRHGAVHGAFEAASVTIGLDGRPMLGGLVRAEAPGRSHATAQDDVVALARLGLSLLAAEPTEVRAVLGAAAEPEVLGPTDATGPGGAGALARACERACPALPIRLPSTEVLAARALSSRTETHERPPAHGPRGRRATGRGPVRHRRRTIGVLAAVAVAGGLAAALALGLALARGAGTGPAATPAGTGPAAAGAANPLDPALADPVAAARELTSLRAAAIGASDERALAEVTAEGSPARERDVAFLRRLVAAGVRLDGLSVEVVAAVGLSAPSSPEDGELTARVMLTSRVGAHRLLGPGGAVLREVPATEPYQVVLVLRWTGAGWRVSDVERATP